MSRLNLVLLIHAHQPVGNFDDVHERAYAQAYLPFVELLLRHPSIRLGLHYSGALLEWIEHRHPEFFDLLRELVRREQVELVGGGFYEPILIAIPPEDGLEQIRRLSEYLEKHFGRRPTGAWLAERVWEPSLPSTLAQAGVDYTLVDDNHFLASGFEPGDLFGSYIAEDLGATVKILPGLQALRYLVPFRSIEENLDFLRAAAREHPGGLAAMGDDCEKFGVWPGTYKHCYADGWLERYLSALEANAGWLVTQPPGDFLASHPPLGRADLPAASYAELMEWALPTPARQRFHAVQEEFSSRAEVRAFLRGGAWRNFFTKYPEANLLHKKMLHVSEKVRRLGGIAPRGRALRRTADEAATHLFRAQCNDAYWHGIFGGVYAPHLRSALWRELVCAETLVDGAEHGRGGYAELARFDFDADGREEICVTSDQFAALLKPSDGGTLAALDFRPAQVTLINSIQRRPEAYHARLREPSQRRNEGAVSIHGRTTAKEQGLEDRLRYDRWARHAFRLLVFPPEKTFEDFEAVRLEECAGLAGGLYGVVRASASEVDLCAEAQLGPPLTPDSSGLTLRAAKAFSFSKGPGGFGVSCAGTLSHCGPEMLRCQVGFELVLNLLAPDSADRYFEFSGGRRPLSWAAAVPASELRLVDEWQNVALAIEAPAAREFWIAPIETVSESEEGFERVYQGSQILGVCSSTLEPGVPWSASVALRVARAR